MLESYAVGVKFELVSNVASVLGKTIADVEAFERAVKSASEVLSGLAKELRSISGAARGVRNLAEALGKLDAGKVGGATDGMNRFEAATERARREAEALTRATRSNSEAAAAGAREAARANRGSGGATRPPGAFGANDDYPNARAENASRDQAYNRARSLAEHENASLDAAARRAGAAAAQRFDEDYALGMRENAERDAMARAAGRAAAARFNDDYALGMRENADRDASARRQSRTAAQGAHRGEQDLVMAGIGASMVGGALLEAVKHTMTPAIDVNRTRDVLAADMRLSPADVEAAMNRASETTRLAPGTTIGENLASTLDLKSVFGDLSEAEHLLPEFARMTALFQALDKKGGGQGRQAFAAAKALEVMGGMVDEHTDASGHTVRTINPELGMQRLRSMERVAVATNLNVMPSDYLGFAKQARVAGMTLTDEFIYQKLPAMLEVMGGQRVGTALMSMAQVFRGDKLTDKSMAAMIQIGLASPAGLVRVGGHLNRRGQMTGGKVKVNEDAIYDLDLMGHDTQLYLAAAQKRMEAHGIHGTEAQITALMRASQRSTIAGIFADILKDEPAILKTQTNVVNTRPDMAEHMAAVDPAAKIQQFEAALTNLATELGSAGMGDAMRVLDSVTAGLNALGQWAHDHPTMARVLFDVASGLGALAAALGGLSAAVLAFGPALRLIGLVGGGAGAAAAAPSGVGLLAGMARFGPWGAAAAVGAAAVLGGYKAATDPNTDRDVRQRDVDAAHAAAAASRNLPQSGNFVPHDGPVAYAPDGTPITNQSFHSANQHFHIYLDGRELHAAIQPYRDRDAQRPRTGPASFDPRLHVLYPT